jgi:hypothetical protein
MEKSTGSDSFHTRVADAFGEENVSCIAAIHHPLRHVETCTGEIAMTIYILCGQTT